MNFNEMFAEIGIRFHSAFSFVRAHTEPGDGDGDGYIIS